MCQSHTNNLQPSGWQGGMGEEGVRVIDCGGFSVHRACLFIHAVKHAQMLLFGDEWSFVLVQHGGSKCHTAVSSCRSKNPQDTSGRFFLLALNLLLVFHVTLSSSTTTHTYINTYTGDPSLCTPRCIMAYSVINIDCIHKDLSHTKSKYIVNSMG